MLSRLSRLRCLSLFAASVLLVQGCAATGAGGEPLSPAQQDLRGQTERFNDTVGTGVVVGAIALGILGAILGGRDNRAGGAALGAAAGAALGGAGGYYIASRNERYASREQAANARYTAASREADDLARTANAAEQVAAENRQKLAALQARLKAGQANAAQLQAQARTAREDLGLMNDAISHSRKVEAAMAQDGVRDQAGRVAESRRKMEEAARALEGALAQVPAA